MNDSSSIKTYVATCVVVCSIVTVFVALPHGAYALTRTDLENDGRVSQADIDALYASAPQQTVDDFLSSVSLDDVVDFINTSSGTLLGQTLDQLGISDLVGIFSRTTDLSDLASVLLDSGISTIDSLLDSVSLGDFSTLLNAVSSGDISDALLTLGTSALGDILSGVSISDFGDVLLSLGSSDLGSLVDAIGTVDFNDFVNTLGSGTVIDAVNEIGIAELGDIFSGGESVSTLLGGALGDALGSLTGGLLGGSGCGYTGIPGKVGSPLIAGAFGGLHVPVKDFEAEAYLRTIMANSFATSLNTAAIASYTDAARRYLQLLCQKEYVLDPQWQNAWAEVIGQFVRTAQNWVLKVYNGNPIFITSQTVYYQLVDDTVYEDFIKEVRNSGFDKEVARDIIAAFEKERYESLLPVDGVKFAPAGVADALATNYENSGGTKALAQLLLQTPQSESGAMGILRTELNQRRQKIRQYEEQKLDWGQGFFSYELCDLAIYKLSSFDRRNCRVVTPGSVIKDQVSLMFSTAVRQMENADEINEKVAANTITILSDIFSYAGIDNVEGGVSAGGYQTRLKEPTTPLNPQEGAARITPFEQRPPTATTGDKRKPVWYPIEFRDIESFEKKAFTDVEEQFGGGDF